MEPRDLPMCPRCFQLISNPELWRSKEMSYWSDYTNKRGTQLFLQLACKVCYIKKRLHLELSGV